MRGIKFESVLASSPQPSPPLREEREKDLSKAQSLIFQTKSGGTMTVPPLANLNPASRIDEPIELRRQGRINRDVRGVD